MQHVISVEKIKTFRVFGLLAAAMVLATGLLALGVVAETEPAKAQSAPPVGKVAFECPGSKY